MTSQKEHLQLLIAEIDSVLQRANPRLPWVMSGEVAQQRQILERVRNYLVSLQQSLPEQEGESSFSRGRQPSDPYTHLSPLGETQADLTPYQMMQAILREVTYLRSNLTQPGLNPQPVNPSQVTAELLQLLMSRLQENLSQQIAQTLDQLRQQPSPYGSPPIGLPGSMPNVTTAPQYEQLQALRSRSDQMLVNLDSTLNVVFESLQRNIQAYQDALSQGVERMYSMGQQSEYTFKLLLDQLVQQLKQEASAYLLSSQSPQVPASTAAVAPQTEPEVMPAATLLPSLVSPPAPQPLAKLVPPAAANNNFPYAGTEFLSSEISDVDSTPPSIPLDLPQQSGQVDTPLDSAIESWLQSVSAMNRDVDAPPTDDPATANFPTLDLSHLELGTINLDAPLAPADFEATQQNLPTTTAPVFDRPATPPASSPPQSPRSDADEEDTSDIDAALKLLEELSAELETSANALSLEDAEAQLEQMLSATPVEESGVAKTTLPDDARDELDEFYQSLFGSEESEKASQPTSTHAAATSPEPDADAPGTLSALSDIALESQSLVVEETRGQETRGQEALELLGTSELLPLPSAESEIGESIAPELPLSSLELPADLFEVGVSPTEAIALPTIDPATSLESDDLGSLSDLFQGVPETAARSIPADPPGISPMLPTIPVSVMSEPQELFLADNLFDPEPPQEGTDDQFTRAIPEEILLPEEEQNIPGFTLELDDLTLSSLSEDLFNLEGRFEAESPIPGVNSGVMPELTLNDLATDVSATDVFGIDQTTATVSMSAPPTAAAPPPNLTTPAAEMSLPDAVAPLPSSTSSETGAKPFYQASPAIADLSLDSFSDLFGDASTPPPAPIPPLTIPATEPLPFTLEGTSTLFDEAVEVPPIPPIPSMQEPSPFTLEGMDDLFETSPAVKPPHDQTVTFIPPPSPTLVAPPTITPPSPEPEEVFTLEAMDDVFGHSPTAPQPSAESASPRENSISPGHAAGTNGASVTPRSQPPRALRREIPPFKPELYNSDDVVEALPPFQLEQLDNLFVDAPSNSEVSAPSLPEGAATSSPAASPDKRSLDAALESFFGAPSTSTSPDLPSHSTPQKKKTL